MLYLFENYALDTDRRELRCGSTPVSVEPQVFDLLAYLIENRERVVSKDDLLAAIWHGRSVSDSALTSRVNAARCAIGEAAFAWHAHCERLRIMIRIFSHYVSRNLVFLVALDSLVLMLSACVGTSFQLSATGNASAFGDLVPQAGVFALAVLVVSLSGAPAPTC